MKRSVSVWRLALVVGPVVLASVLFRWFGPTLDLLGASVLGALPVGLAARFYGPRIALVTLLVEVAANVDLMIGSSQSQSLSPIEIAEGIGLCVLGLAAGGALAEKQRVAKALLTDPLTGLANRERLLQWVSRLMKTGDARLTVAMVHVPELSEISETFGSDVSTVMLRTIARRIESLAGPDGLAVKGIRDLFAVVWPTQPLEDADVARAIIACASGAFQIRGATLEVGAHASVARWSVVGGSEPDDLIRAAQRALDTAAQSGREWAVAERGSDHGPSRLEIISDLRRGIAAGELRLHYQPIVDLPSLKLRGLEALVRWDHPTRGLLPPGDFIALAERSGLIVQLTEWVFHEVMRQMHRWAAVGLRPHISVNVGAKLLSPSAHLAELVDRLLGSYGVEPERIVLEVTETDVMADPTRGIAVLNALKALGLRIEIDDFGTGHSSLSYLRQMPLDGVKIDRSFMRTLLTDANTAAIVRAAIDLSHALGLEALAEGVEDKDTLSSLIASGCDSAQGFLFARPMPADAVVGWLAATGSAVSDTENAPMPARSTARTDTVLIVEDEPRFRLSTHRILSAGGFQVLSAATASEALQIYNAQRERITVVLTDVKLPDWRGNELVQRMRDARPDLRVMYMSGDARELSTAGADRFLLKPFSKRELLDGIQEALVT